MKIFGNNRVSTAGNAEIVVAVLIALGILIFAGTTTLKQEEGSKNQGAETEVIKKKADVDTPPLPEGEDTYSISSGEAGPEVYAITINPLGGAKPGTTQSLRVKVRHEFPVQSVKVTIIMDNGSHPVSLSLTEGTNLDGVWTGSWEVTDTHEAVYQAEIEAVGDDAVFDATLTFQPLE